MSSPSQMFDGSGAVALLFLTESQNSGHWLAVLDHRTNYEVFDSFGVAIDGNRKWLDRDTLEDFDQTAPLLSRLLSKGEKPVTHNTVKLQQDSNDTCGRWICARIMNANMPLDKFVHMMKNSGSSPDDAVTRMTARALGK